MKSLLTFLLGLAVLALWVPTAAAQATFYFSDFEADDGGWAGTGDWEWGAPSTDPDTTACFKTGPVFPAGAASGSNVWGTDLDACHSGGLVSELTQTFDFSLVSGNIMLCWMQFINSGGNTFDMAEVVVNGSQVYLDDGSSGGLYEQQCVGLDAYANTAVVDVNFRFTTTTVVERAGWYVDDVEITADNIPVELTRFDAQVDGRDVLLTWETASETNNAGFEVQMQQGGAWAALGFVAGHGTTTEARTYQFSADGLLPGPYAFRLKQIDFDGAFEYHGEIEATVGTPGTHLLSAAYPNPFNPQTQFTLAVARDQQVTVMLYNALGQRVTTLYEGTLEANHAETFRVEAAGLASGLYLVRVTGETFADALRLTLMK